ncbi:MAG: DNA repair protein RecN [Pseudomonadota bacterium]
MLEHLRVHDFAIIDSVDTAFAGGMTALTGETGAGKSILFDAIGLVLGDRAERGSVRDGAERAEIEARFHVQSAADAARWLHEHDLDEDGLCTLRRVVARDGRSRAYVNGRSVTMQALRELGEMLVHIHGQHEHQHLTRSERQRHIVDARADIEDELAELHSLHARWRACVDAHKNAEAVFAERSNRLDLLQFQVQELQQIQHDAADIERLFSEHTRLSNAEQLIATTSELLDRAFDSEHSARDQLSHAERLAHTLADTDAQLANLPQLIVDALINLDEAASLARTYLSQLELDPSRLEDVEKQTALIHSLARKHQLSGHALPELRAKLEHELQTLQREATSPEELERKAQDAHKAYLDRARRVSSARRAAATALSDEVTAELQTLGMGGGLFVVEVNENPEHANAHGIDHVELRVSANPGQTPKPLAKVASGGELSRISLAIQLVASRYAAVPSLIFDEVDAGIGGGVAEIVGKQLRQLSARCQVMCVTHLPQVASQAQNHIAVQKTVNRGHTRTTPTVLKGKARVDEIARMLGGVKLTAKVRSHAREMLSET